MAYNIFKICQVSMDNTFQCGYFNNGVPIYCIHCTQNLQSVQQPPIIQRQCDNWYYVCPEDGQAVRYCDGSIKYHIITSTAPIACQNYMNTQTNQYPENRDEYYFQQQFAMKQLELQMLETQLRGEAIKKMPPYQLVFHSDAATSTTDLSYFTQAWRNNYSNMVKANAFAQYNKPNLPENMQVDPCNTINYLKSMQDSDHINNKGKGPVKVQFNDNITIFYTNDNTDYSNDSDNKDVKIDCSCEMMTDSNDCNASTSKEILNRSGLD